MISRFTTVSHFGTLRRANRPLTSCVLCAVQLLEAMTSPIFAFSITVKDFQKSIRRFENRVRVKGINLSQIGARENEISSSTVSREFELARFYCIHRKYEKEIKQSGMW